MGAVRCFRAKSKRKSTLAIADYPTRYNVEVIPTAPFLAVPKVSSERREYVPAGWLEPPTIPSDLIFVLRDATLADFGLLTSAMHMAWLRHIGGRLKSDYRYSIGLVYNTFPMPPDGADVSKLEPLAHAVFDARAAHPHATLADLYDPDLMPPNLRRAHRALDRNVDRLYRRAGFASERERVEHLFMLFETMRSPLGAKLTRRTKRRRVRPCWTVDCPNPVEPPWEGPVSVQSLDDIAHAIDSASDAGDESSLRQLGVVCEHQLSAAKGVDRTRR